MSYKHTATGPRPVLLMALLATILAGGCTSSYTVTVRNDTDRPVSARIEHRAYLAEREVLAQKKIEANSEGTLGPVRVAIGERVELAVDTIAELGLPSSRTRLERSKTIVQITPADRFDSGPPRLRVVRD